MIRNWLILSTLLILASPAYADPHEEPSESTKRLSELITGIRGMGSYRQNAYNAQVKSTVRNFATAEEAYYVDNEQYISCSNQECGKVLPYASIPEEISITIAATKESYKIVGKRKDGSGKTYIMDSENGLLEESSE